MIKIEQTVWVQRLVFLGNDYFNLIYGFGANLSCGW